jgi:tetratricopeptide (TPR) repeat protein
MSGDERSDLRQTFEKLWEEIRGGQLYAGQPRNAQSSTGVALAHEALRLATEANDENLLLEAWRMLAYSLSADEQWVEAIPYYEQAISGYESRGQHAFAARRLRIGYVNALMLTGRYDDALNAARTAEHWLKESGDMEGYAKLCTNLANLHQRLDQYQQSCEYYARALAVFEASGDRQAVAMIYQNLGYPLGRLDRFDEAEATYERAEQLAAELGMLELGAQARYNRAYLSFLRGRYSEALQSFSRVRTHFKGLGSILHFALCDLDEAEIYLQLNIAADAATLAQSASQQFKSIGMVYEEAKAMAYHGVALTQMQRYTEALEVFKDAQKKFESEGNQYWVGVLDLYRADVHLELRRYWEAHSLAIRAKERFEALQIPSRRLLSLVILGRIALSMDDTASAENHMSQVPLIAEQSRTPLLRFRITCCPLKSRNANRSGQRRKSTSAWPRRIWRPISHGSIMTTSKSLSCVGAIRFMNRWFALRSTAPRTQWRKRIRGAKDQSRAGSLNCSPSTCPPCNCAANLRCCDAFIA